MKVFLPPVNRSMKLYKLTFTKIPWDADPLPYFLREELQDNGQSWSHQEIQILGLHLSHGQERQRAQKPE